MNLNYKLFNFPCGEMHVEIGGDSHNEKQAVTGTLGDNLSWNLTFSFKKTEDIFELLLVVDALKRCTYTINNLYIPYVPFSRQDRVNTAGEPLSLKVFTDLINGIGAKLVTIKDPHSDVTPALINNCLIIHQHDIFSTVLEQEFKVPFYLVSPDAGALKKIHKLSKILTHHGVEHEVLECSKIRNTKTGDITGVKTPDILDSRPCVIVDDICDGGRTFIEIAKVLKEKGTSKVHLCVSHGFFTKGLEVFDGLIDSIRTSNGRVF